MKPEIFAMKYFSIQKSKSHNIGGLPASYTSKSACLPVVVLMIHFSTLDTTTALRASGWFFTVMISSPLFHVSAAGTDWREMVIDLNNG